MAGHIRPTSRRITRTILTPQFLFLEVDNGWWCDDWAKPDDTSRGVLGYRDEVFEFLTVALVYNFPRTGGTVQCRNLIFKYTPPIIPDDVMRMRVYLALPYDFWNHEGDLQRVGMTALIAQSYITFMIRHRHGRLIGDIEDWQIYTTFYDECWSEAKAEVPGEERTETSGSFVYLTDPQFTATTCSIGILKLDKKASEIFEKTDHIAQYVRQRLGLLGQIDSNKLVHLVFFPDLRELGEKEAFETYLDVSVIKSSGLQYVPPTANLFLSSLADTSPATRRDAFARNRSCFRIVERVHGDEFLMRHTTGGLLSSFLGAVIHEIVHLFKIEHSDSGIMKDGGLNIQSAILPDERINMGLVMNSLWPRYRQYAITQYFDGPRSYVDMRVRIDYEELREKCAESHFDPVTTKLLRLHPLITHKSRVSMKEVRYDKEARTVMSDAGFAYLVYYSNDQAAKMLRCVCAFPREQVKVDVGSARVLAVTCEGNFFSFVVD